MSDPEITEVQFHTFSIVYFQLVKYLHPDCVIEIDVPNHIIEELELFTEQALDMLAETTDPFESLFLGVARFVGKHARINTDFGD